MGALNILPQYRDYFQLTNSLRSFNIAINYIGGSLAVGNLRGFLFALPLKTYIYAFCSCSLVAFRADTIVPP